MDKYSVKKIGSKGAKAFCAVAIVLSPVFVFVAGVLLAPSAKVHGLEMAIKCDSSGCREVMTLPGFTIDIASAVRHLLQN